MPRSRRLSGTAALWLAPSGIGVAAFFLAPLLVLVWLTTQSWDLLTPPRWAGGANLGALGDGAFGHALGMTAIIGAIALVVQLGGGFLLAELLMLRLAGTRLVGTLLLLPWLIAPLAVGVLARWFAAPSDGVIASALGRRFDAVVDPVAAPVLIAAVVAWQGTGFAALVYTAALRAIPTDLHRMAQLDGLTRAGISRRIDWPLVAPTTAFLGVIGVVQAFGLYDLIVPLTGGGPDGATETVAVLVVRNAWEFFDVGRASVLAVGSVAVEAVLIAVIVLWGRRRS